MTIKNVQNPYQYLEQERYSTPLQMPERLISQDEMVRRIEAVRAESGPPICGACGSATPEVKDRKWCPRCQSLLVVARFSKDRSRSDNLHPLCKSCESARGKAYRTKIALSERRAG